MTPAPAPGIPEIKIGTSDPLAFVPADHADHATPSAAAHRQFLADHAHPLLVCDWRDALFVHYRLDPRKLRPAVPFDLVTRDGQAYVTLVLFTMEHFRLGLFPRLGTPITGPVARYAFLNVRTYVRYRDEEGVYFLTEYVSNRIAAALAPRTFGLPYRLGRLDLAHDTSAGSVRGTIAAPGGSARLVYHARFDPDTDFTPAPGGSPRAFFAERYTAFTDQRRLRRRFRIWHEPWAATPVSVEMLDTTLLSLTGGWHAHATLEAAHYSPGVSDVWIGPPVCVEGPGCATTWKEEPAS